jgi:hypothetical protein
MAVELDIEGRRSRIGLNSPTVLIHQRSGTLHFAPQQKREKNSAAKFILSDDLKNSSEHAM